MWTDHVSDSGVAGTDPIGVTSGQSGSVRASSSVTSHAGGLSGLAGWQVVVGPRLPTLAPLAGRGARHHLRNPAVLLAITTAMSVVPAMMTDTPGAGRLAVVRLVTGFGAAVAVGASRRLPSKWRPLVAVLPLAFVALQIAAMVSTFDGYRGDGSAIGAAAPHLFSTAIAAAMAIRTIPSLIRRRTKGSRDRTAAHVSV